MIFESSSQQATLSEFDWRFQNQLDALSDTYYRKMSADQDLPATKARVVIGTLIIKHKLVLSDRKTVGQIQENPYMQYFIVLKVIRVKSRLMRRYWVIPHLYAQQKQMFDERTHRCENRIVSIHQPWVRPIVRGKQHKPCLLYTSPSPRDRQKSRMPSSA